MSATNSSNVLETPDSEIIDDSKKRRRQLLVKKFKQTLDNIADEGLVLMDCERKVAELSKGSRWSFPDGNGGTFYLDQKSLKTQKKNWEKKVKNGLYELFKEALKGTRDSVPLEKLGGIYIPVLCGQAVTKFLSADPQRFGYVDPTMVVEEDGTSHMKDDRLLIEQLELARGGLTTRNTIGMLLIIYAHVNKLQDPKNGQFIIADDHMKECFGGTVPAVWYRTKDENNEKGDRFFMGEAVKNNLIDRALNTFEVIEAHKPDIKNTTGKSSNSNKNDDDEQSLKFPDRFHMALFQNINALNYITANDFKKYNMTDHQNRIKNVNIRNMLVREHIMVKNANDAAKLIAGEIKNIKKKGTVDQ